MTKAYEVDNGPGGMSWELTDEQGDFVASVPRDTDLAKYAPVSVYTFADYEANEPLIHDPRPALVIEVDRSEWEEADRNLSSLGFPVFDGSGCRIVDLGTEVYGLVDYDGVYRLGLYWNLPEDDGGVCAEFKDFESFRSFVVRLGGVCSAEGC